MLSHLREGCWICDTNRWRDRSLSLWERAGVRVRSLGAVHWTLPFHLREATPRANIKLGV
jgi:hypothetical protein